MKSGVNLTSFPLSGLKSQISDPFLLENSYSSLRSLLPTPSFPRSSFSSVSSLTPVCVCSDRIGQARGGCGEVECVSDFANLRLLSQFCVWFSERMQEAGEPSPLTQEGARGSTGARRGGTGPNLSSHRSNYPHLPRVLIAS